MKRQKTSFAVLLAFFLFNSINAQELFNENNKNFHPPSLLAIKAEADKGNARAQAYIGFSYEKGIYFTKDEANAIKFLFRKGVGGRHAFFCNDSLRYLKKTK